MKRPKGKPPSQRQGNTPIQKPEKIRNATKANSNLAETISNANVLYHEAGHAVACLVLDLGLEYVETGAIPIPGGISHGRTVPSLTALDAEGDLDICRRLAVQALAGQEAEIVFEPSDKYVGKLTTDMEGAMDACSWCICEMTISADGRKVIRPEEWNAHQQEIRAMTNQALAGAKRLVRAYWPFIDRLAKALSEQTRMTGDEVRFLIPELSKNT